MLYMCSVCVCVHACVCVCVCGEGLYVYVCTYASGLQACMYVSYTENTERAALTVLVPV